MLLQCDGNTVKIMPGMPHNIDVSFKLAIKGGATVEASVNNGKLTSIIILKNGINITDKFFVKF